MALKERWSRFAALVADVRGGGGPGALLARGSSSAFAIRASGLVLVLGNQVLLARVLGTASYGDYVYVMTWLTVLVLVATSGPGGAAVRFVAQYVGQADWGGLRGFRRRSYQWSLGVGLFLGGTVLVLVGRLSGAMSPSLMGAFHVGAVLLPLWALVELTSAILRGHKRIVAAQLPSEVLRPALFAAAIGALWALGVRPIGAPVALLTNLVVTGACAALLVWLLHGVIRSLPTALPVFRGAEWARVGLPMVLMGGFGLVLSSADTIMLGAMRGTAEAGVYSVAARGAGLVSFMLAAATVIAAPLISEYHSTGQARRLERLIGLTAWLGTAFAIPVAATLLLAGRLVLAVFGPDFVPGYGPLVILALAQLANVSCGAVVPLLAMSGRHTRAMAVIGAAAGVNILLNAVLIPRFGSLGAAVATASSMLLWNVVLTSFSIRTMRLNPTVFQRWWRGGRAIG